MVWILIVIAYATPHHATATQTRYATKEDCLAIGNAIASEGVYTNRRTFITKCVPVSK